jgi:hypothetical protein
MYEILPVGTRVFVNTDHAQWNGQGVIHEFNSDRQYPYTVMLYDTRTIPCLPSEIELLQ